MLLRFVADGRGHLVLDVLKRATGRGVYLCPTIGCIEMACRRGAWNRGLRRRVAAVEPAALHASCVEAVGRVGGQLVGAAASDGRAVWAGAGPPAWEGAAVRDAALGCRVAALVQQLGRLREQSAT